MRRSAQKYLPTPAWFSRDELSIGDFLYPVTDDLPSFEFWDFHGGENLDFGLTSLFARGSRFSEPSVTAQ